MGDIVRFPQNDMIEHLEQVLSAVRAGELLTIAIVEVRKDGTTVSGWHATGGGYHGLLAATTRLMFRIAAEDD